MYCFGLFYCFPFPMHNKNAILLMVDGLLMLKEFNYELITNVSHIRRFNSNNVHFKPLLCRLDDNIITEIIFLDDLIAQDKGKNNSFFVDVNEKSYSAVLLYNNEPFIDNFIINEKEKLFGKYLVDLAACMKMVSCFEQKVSFISPSTREYQDNDMRRITRDLMKIVESYDIQKIVSSMRVEVNEGHSSKIGDDDHYWIIRTAYIEDKAIPTDGYIDEILGIGSKYIYDSKGYVRWETLATKAPEVYIGVYSGKALEDERNKVLSKYSKEEHLAYLIFSKLNDKNNAIEEMKKWKAVISQIEDNININFRLDKIKHLDKRFFEGFNIKQSIDSINYYLKNIQLVIPTFRIVISGALSYHDSLTSESVLFDPKEDVIKQIYINEIIRTIEELIPQYYVVIITGNANGAENFSLNYAIEKKLDFIDNYNEWTKSGQEEKIDRYYEMAKMADLILLTPFSDSHLYINFVKAAKELGVPLKIIDEMTIV